MIKSGKFLGVLCYSCVGVGGGGVVVFVGDVAIALGVGFVVVTSVMLPWRTKDALCFMLMSFCHEIREAQGTPEMDPPSF